MLEDVGYAGAVGRRGTERDVEDFVVIFVFEKEHAGTALVVAEEVAVCMDIVNLLFLQQGIGFAMFCVHFCISFLVFLYYFRFYAVKNGPQCPFAGIFCGPVGFILRCRFLLRCSLSRRRVLLLRRLQRCSVHFSVPVLQQPVPSLPQGSGGRSAPGLP